MNGSSIYELPDAEARSRDPGPEERLCAERLAEMRRYRDVVQTAAIPIFEQCPTSPVLVLSLSRGDDHQTCAESIRHQRYQHLTLQDVQIPAGLPLPQQLAGLHRALHGCAHPYLLLANADFYYDESFLMEAMEHLSQCSDAGVCWGVWLAEEGNIREQALTRHRPKTSWQDVRAAAPALTDPLNLLGLGLFRSDFLCYVLELGSMLRDPDEIGEFLFSALESPGIFKTGIPAVIVPCGAMTS